LTLTLKTLIAVSAMGFQHPKIFCWRLAAHVRGDHMDNEEQEDKEKRAPTETRHNGSGSLFIHFLVSLIPVLFLPGLGVISFVLVS
jgi:hypothetical protein